MEGKPLHLFMYLPWNRSREKRSGKDTINVISDPQGAGGKRRPPWMHDLLLAKLTLLKDRMRRLVSPLTLILQGKVTIPEIGATLSVGTCMNGISSKGVLVNEFSKKREDHENTKEAFPLNPSSGPF